MLATHTNADAPVTHSAAPAVVPPAAQPTSIDPEVRRHMIAEAAWYRFQARGFVHGYHVPDWIDAEREVDQRLQQLSSSAASCGSTSPKSGDTHGFKPTVHGCDNLEIIEGIGPKIAKLLVDHGIASFAALAAAKPETLKDLLHQAGRQYALAVPTTWPEQAALAVKGDWAALAALQKALDGGVRH